MFGIGGIPVLKRVNSKDKKKAPAESPKVSPTTRFTYTTATPTTFKDLMHPQIGRRKKDEEDEE